MTATAVPIYIRRDLSLVTWVGEEDYTFLIKWTWGLQVDNRGKLYVRRYIGRCNLYLHRVIMRRVESSPSPAHKYVDHINGNGLDNRRENLRWATASENAKNVARLKTSAQTVDAGWAVKGLLLRSGVASQSPPLSLRAGLEIPGFE